MKTFKIRDLMIALRPGIGTPQRPKPFDCCLPTCDEGATCDDGVSIEPFDDTGGCGECTDDDSGCDCTADDSGCGCTDACTAEDSGCGCTDACTAGCTEACTEACTAGCTEACTAACTDACTGACTKACTKACTIACTKACTICTGRCTACTVTCGPLTRRCGVRPSLEPPLPVEKMDSADLARLKTQLRTTISKVRQRDKALAANAEKKAAAPQSVEEVDALAKLLSDALEELRSKRAEIEKSGPAKSDQPKKGGKS